MGTRHLILVYYKGQYLIAQYGQWDGYPSGQGLTILRFVRNPENLSRLRAVLDRADTMLYEPTAAQLEQWYEEMDRVRREHSRRGSLLKDPEEVESWMNVHFPGSEVCPSVSRDTGARILEEMAKATEPVPLVRELEFLADRLFCEWAYVVDLDADVVEVYSSRLGSKDAEKSGRFKDVEVLKDGYVPPMVGAWGFGELPDEHGFLRAFKDGDE